MKMNNFSLQILKSSPLQKCPNIAKHAIYGLLPIVITPSVLQQKQNKWRNVIVAPDMKSDSAPLLQMLVPNKGRDIQ